MNRTFTPGPWLARRWAAKQAVQERLLHEQQSAERAHWQRQLGVSKWLNWITAAAAVVGLGGLIGLGIAEQNRCPGLVLYSASQAAKALPFERAVDRRDPWVLLWVSEFIEEKSCSWINRLYSDMDPSLPPTTPIRSSHPAQFAAANAVAPLFQSQRTDVDFGTVARGYVDLGAAGVGERPGQWQIVRLHGKHVVPGRDRREVKAPIGVAAH
jgi:hypothetical protein